MKRRRWGQILLGIGIGVLIGTLITYLQQHDVRGATFMIGLALLFLAIGLTLMRRS
jgi:ABC-type uncharacterized transport system permease subunit